jgi:pyridoxamine 5'-phosphate oxidase
MSRADPVARLRRWLAAAARAGAPLPDAAALATAGRDARPTVRFVLLRGLDARGLVFFTDARSAKGRHVTRNPRAALAFYWDATGRQVRVEGRVAPVTAAEADAYWASRPRRSRLAASVSHQSARLASRTALLRRWRRLGVLHRGQDVPRPRYWSGFRVRPERIEFWTRRAYRLHERELFVRARHGWRRMLLQP